MDALLSLLSLWSGSIVSWPRLWRKLRMSGIKRTKLCRKTQLWGRKSTRCAGTSRCVFRTQRGRLQHHKSLFPSHFFTQMFQQHSAASLLQIPPGKT